MNELPPEEQLDIFMERYDPEVRETARGALARMRAILPGAVELVYDNYNALVIGFGSSERASEAVVSIALYPRWVTLFFLQGVALTDPEGLLRGDGKLVRSIVLEEGGVLDRPAVRALLAVAAARAPEPFDEGSPRRMVIKSVSAKQRPRRPRTVI